MAQQRLGIIMNGVTGRMGMNQHLIRSIVAIRAQGGVALRNGDTVMPCHQCFRFELLPQRRAPGSFQLSYRKIHDLKTVQFYSQSLRAHAAEHREGTAGALRNLFERRASGLIKTNDDSRR